MVNVDTPSLRHAQVHSQGHKNYSSARIMSATPSSAGAGPSAPQWRSFTFFDLDEVKDQEDLAQSPRLIRVSSLLYLAHLTSAMV